MLPEREYGQNNAEKYAQDRQADQEVLDIGCVLALCCVTPVVQIRLVELQQNRFFTQR